MEEIKMGKISLITAKYIIHAKIEIEGVVEKPDVVGAIFGQTEGLLGTDLELRELQKSGRIGRIEVDVETKTGKTSGKIIIPSSLDRAETSIMGAALEIIQRIGPCNATVRIENIEDVRVSKRSFIIERAKELLKTMMETTMPDSQELADEVAYSVRVMEIQEFGKDRLPAGPGIEDADEIIIVEGRADVLTMLKYGFKNVIGINGTSIPQTIVDISKGKITTLFVDGDRGGDLIIREMSAVVDLDYVTKAPDGKEVEELQKKEIHKALRSRISFEQAKMEIDKGSSEGRPQQRTDSRQFRPQQDFRQDRQGFRPRPEYNRSQQDFRQQRPAERQEFQQPAVEIKKATDAEKVKFKSMLEDLIGTRGAYVLDEKLNILGKVPFTELLPTLKSLGTGVYAVVFDGIIDRDLVQTAERANIKFLVGMEAKATSPRLSIMTSADF